jgi:hypothetical protein
MCTERNLASLAVDFSVLSFTLPSNQPGEETGMSLSPVDFHLLMIVSLGRYESILARPFRHIQQACVRLSQEFHHFDIAEFSFFPQPHSSETEEVLLNFPAIQFVFGISAFLKGPHQLGSKIPIYRGGKRSPGTEVRSHHITPHLQTRVSLLTLIRFGGGTSHRNCGSYNGKVTMGLTKLRWYEDLLTARNQFPLKDPVLLEFFRRSRYIVKEETLRRKRIGKYDFSNSFTEESQPTRSKGIQESFRRGPRDGAETPKPWNSRLAHKVHPYWSTNLKYVY